MQLCTINIFYELYTYRIISGLRATTYSSCQPQNRSRISECWGAGRSYSLHDDGVSERHSYNCELLDCANCIMLCLLWTGWWSPILLCSVHSNMALINHIAQITR